jgi:hypothetical protein
MEISHEQEILNRLSRLGEQERKEALQFLAPFNWSAQLYLSDVIQRCLMRQKLSDRTVLPARFEPLMKVLRQKKEEVWDHGDPDRLGDPDCLQQGLRNAEAMMAIYKQFGFVVKGIH